MAQAKFIPLLTATTGLNNALDPVRIEYDLKTGITELSQAINVDIDNSGRINRRLGRTIKNVLPARCGFASGEVCLFVSGATLRLMRNDYATAVLRTDLTVGARMRYRLIAGRVYYTNGVQKGYVFREQNYTWEKGEYTAAGDDRRIFSNPPNGHIVSWFAGRALMARENAIFASEPSFYGVFDLHNGARLVPDRVTMIHPTTNGLWVGTTTQIMFYEGTKWEELKRRPKASYGVLEGSDAECSGEKLGSPDNAVLFTTTRGICAGSEGGEFANLTDKKLIFPAGRYANATVVNNRYIVLIDP